MRAEKQAILGMIAAGRISPGEGERLLAATESDERWLWAAALGLVLYIGTAHADTVIRGAVQCAQWIGGMR